MPGALSLMMIGFLMAGPHHSFSVANPASTGPAVSVRDDWPGYSLSSAAVPYFHGRSIEYGKLFHGIEKLLRARRRCSGGVNRVSVGSSESLLFAEYPSSGIATSLSGPIETVN